MLNGRKYIVVACDSFKGSLTSAEACNAVRAGITDALGDDADVHTVPVSDGGEGLTDIITEALGGEYVTCSTTNAIGEPIEARYGIVRCGKRKLAVIEAAASCGLALIPESARNVMAASSYGMGEMMLHAAENGCDDMIVGLGGSATCDAGMGLLNSFGITFPIEHNRLLAPSGAMLEHIRSIDVSGMNSLAKYLRIRVACDVCNPLFGPCGAAHVFAPQKGATAAEVEILDRGLRNFASKTTNVTGRDISEIPGGGAAGGLGACLYAFFNAGLECGSRLVLDIIGFDKTISKADLIITGEGKLDSQTLMGKIPTGILDAGKRHRVPVVAVGGIAEDGRILLNAGFSDIIQATPYGMPVEEAMRRETAKKNLRRSASEAVHRRFKI